MNTVEQLRVKDLEKKVRTLTITNKELSFENEKLLESNYILRQENIRLEQDIRTVSDERDTLLSEVKYYRTISLGLIKEIR